MILQMGVKSGKYFLFTRVNGVEVYFDGTSRLAIKHPIYFRSSDEAIAAAQELGFRVG